MQVGFFFDQTRCTGCSTCQVACRSWHAGAGAQTGWIRLDVLEKGEYPSLFLAFLFTTCWHCADPPCIKACGPNAITKRDDDGIVVVDTRLCAGADECREACRKACPYDIPRFGVDGKMQKCHLCLERRTEGKRPLCVEACPLRALDSGDLDQLRLIGQASDQAEGFTPARRALPSVVFKPKWPYRQDVPGPSRSGGR